MNNSFKVVVDGSLDYKITTEDISKIDALKTSPNSYHILKENKSFTAQVLDKDFYQKKYTISINNSSYDVVISDSLDLLINDMGFALSSSKDIDSIAAPMPGLILDVHVRIGQAVNEDDPLLILEAMKMENVITSPRDGIIKSISIKKGDAVDKNKLLIEFE
ncbi:acetyl-CoA carboxylase biotin carboxyl carrier protein subunit [uncultured Eudoraea sp.]|uniref:acetyl-CoA carboxylase biotin carboxyl carrier protein subunit n=1 Tax=uncultured Eudoraea sp. TaxID=1035614 RepID=UPI002610624B|nr:acetyl-CoA carboxylase biotin carboxyl carrier protein subunit [uncultured Eudoraea sp.]